MVRPQFTPRQRSFLVQEYLRSKSVSTALQRFRQEFPGVRCPTRVTVYKNARKYSLSGTSHSLNTRRSGRRRTARTVANIEAVRNLLDNAGDEREREELAVAGTDLDYLLPHLTESLG